MSLLYTGINNFLSSGQISDVVGQETFICCIGLIILSSRLLEYLLRNRLDEVLE